MADCRQWGEAKKLWQNAKNVFTMMTTTKVFFPLLLIACKLNEEVKNGHPGWMGTLRFAFPVVKHSCLAEITETNRCMLRIRITVIECDAHILSTPHREQFVVIE